MKKLLLTILASAACIGSITAENFTLVMGDQWGTEDCDLTEWTQQGFTFTPALGENPKGKIPVYKSKNKEVRFYALNTVTISAPTDGEAMTQLIFTLSKQGREEQAVITPSEGLMETQTVGNATVTWTGDSHSVTLTVGATNSLHTEGIEEGSGQFNFTKVEIATGTSEISKPVDTDTEFYMCNASATDGILSTWTQGNLQFSAVRGDDDTVNEPALKNDEEARLYAGNELTISTLDGSTIASLEFALSEQGMQQQAAIDPSVGTMTQAEGINAKWNGDASSITLKVGANEYGTNPAKKGQFDFTKITLVYGTFVSTPAIEEDNNSSYEYYTMQGIKITKPASGIFIRRKGDKSEKIVIR